MRKAVWGACLTVAAFLSFGVNAESASFSVSPVRVYFEAGKQIETITIKNASDEPLVLQTSVFGWTEDENAKDVYSPTEDVILFPKILEVEKEQERVIRVGTKVPPADKEKAYRIYFEEIPKPGAAEKGASLRTLMKVGVPVFISPAEGKADGDIQAKVSEGRLSVTVANSGNVHILIKAIAVEGFDASGASAFTSETAGWYLLSGHSRAYAVELPKNNCGKIDLLKIHVETDKFSREKEISVLPEMCPR